MNLAAHENAPASAGGFGNRMRGLLSVSELGVFVAVVAISLIFYAIAPAFLSAQNIRAIINFVSFVGIIAIGQTILMIGGEFDLSVGSIAGLSACVTAMLMKDAHLPIFAAIIGGLALGAVIGLVNGIVVVKLKIPAFIQTLGMLFIGQGLIQVVTGGNPVYPLPESVGDFGATRVFFGLGYSFVFFFIAGFIADFVLRRTVLGRNLYATGGNAEVARLVGINASLYKICAFVFVSVMASISGMFVMADLASGITSIGTGWELTVIAGVVVGGVSLFGGAGTIIGGLLGMLLLQVIQSGLVVIGVGANWQQIAVGTIMVLAVGLDLLRRRVFIGAHSKPTGGTGGAVATTEQPTLPANAN
ncbi:ABC transporter permease [Kaistia dalseonensis]|uniref:Autoinducer 2 import system permease protein LsrD n=1 Tax=Kaistia dalseonensis TaxID=410840 RepID=A0ABU0H2W8_9HYPH|nr:ABC transporter permease [Kaistia dalseonensis]MCX5494065.1 ABC transporter permease [Kaistia dalseonensis]MDQ0436643.1 ribose transport system permease protein [Kaistia dalseonensis]